jgi:hypothetical protein
MPNGDKQERGGFTPNLEKKDSEFTWKLAIMFILAPALLLAGIVIVRNWSAWFH